MIIPSQIMSNRLIFKPVKTSDLENFYNGFSESFESLSKYYIPAWSRYTECPSKNKMKVFLEETEQKFNDQEGFLFSVFDHKNNFIGQAELHHIDFSVPKARLGYWVRDKESNKGYATEMANILSHFGFNILKCQRLEIRNDVRNPASGIIAKKLGYRFLTVLEKNKQGKTGDFWDIAIYDRLDKDGLPKLEITYD